MEDADELSHLLFGRYQAMRIYATISRFSKAEFTTGELIALTRVESPACSKELAKLVRLGLASKVDRRGRYKRNDESPFWIAMDALARDWESQT